MWKVATIRNIPIKHSRTFFHLVSYCLPLINRVAVPFDGYHIDGEHENERGTVIVAKLFSATLSEWLSS